MGESPIKSKLSQQTSSEPEGDHQQVVSEAGCSEFAGRVSSPEISRVVVRKDNPAVRGESRRRSMVWKAAVSHTPWRVCATPPGSEARACEYRGNRGTGEIRSYPVVGDRNGLCRYRNNLASSSYLSRSVASLREHKASDTGDRYRGTSEQRRTLRGTVGSLSGS